MAQIGTVGSALASQALGQDRGSIRIRMGDGNGPSFAEVLDKALNDVSSLQHRRDDAIGAFLQGDPSVEIHDVMAAAEAELK